MKTILLWLACFISIFELNAQNQTAKWSFEYPNDQFSNNALLDLRYLNEAEAGLGGFVKLSPDSNSFVNEEGKTIRFWAVNGGENTGSWTDDELAQFARFLAKIGVNVIRYHGSLHPVSASSEFTKANPAEINRIQRLVAAMKKEGIYTVISPYYTHKVGEVFSNWNIDGYTGKTKKLSGVIFFHDGLRNAYKQWVTQLFTADNPFTGIPLKDEPAVAVIQTHNEDGVFFYTISNIQPEMAKVVRKKFYDWLINKYTTIELAQSSWGNVSIEGDAPNLGEMGLYIIWEATQATSGAKHKRLTDQIEFFAETQSSFYADIQNHFREIGCKQLINGSNWKAADAVRLLDTERATSSVCDVLALNRYYSPTHTGFNSSPDNSSWRIDPGHYYEGKSVLLSPEKLPINVKQPTAHPVIVTESGWNQPHKYQAEGPFLVSAYSSLSGIDAFFWFSATAPTYDANPYFTHTNLEGGQHPMNRWTISTPGQMAMFPANALTYRLGYVTESQPVAIESRTKESVLNREIPLISEDTGFDPNRDDYVPGANDTQLSGVSYLAGKINVNYNSPENQNFISPNLADLVSFQEKKISSSTGQLNWDYQKGICTLNAPSAQGICGFVGKLGTFELKDVSINTSNDYATVNVVSMDERPISSSGNILVQVGTVYQPDQWSETPTSFTYKNVDYQGYLINNTGQMPWMAEPTNVNLTIKNKNISSVVLLDVAGYPVKELAFSRTGDLISVTLPQDAMYIILKGEVTSSPIKKKIEEEIAVYPNPAKSIVYIEPAGFHSEQLTVEIKTIQGELVLVKNTNAQQTESIDLNGLASGIYIVVIKNKESILKTQKLIVGR